MSQGASCTADPSTSELAPNLAILPLGPPTLRLTRRCDPPTRLALLDGIKKQGSSGIHEESVSKLEVSVGSPRRLGSESSCALLCPPRLGGVLARARSPLIILLFSRPSFRPSSRATEGVGMALLATTTSGDIDGFDFVVGTGVTAEATASTNQRRRGRCVRGDRLLARDNALGSSEGSAEQGGAAADVSAGHECTCLSVRLLRQRHHHHYVRRLA